jgi:hypothetical protein
MQDSNGYLVSSFCGGICEESLNPECDDSLTTPDKRQPLHRRGGPCEYKLIVARHVRDLAHQSGVVGPLVAYTTNKNSPSTLTVPTDATSQDL